MPTFTILQGKETQQPKKPLFLVTITAPDGDVTYLTTAAYYGAPNIVYNGNTHAARILNSDFAAIQAMGQQGYDSLPGFTLTLADADKSLWTNHCIPHGWGGSTITLTVILWDIPANQYSTDALQWKFIGGNPQYNAQSGTLTVEATSATNFTRLKVPSVPLEYRCPWDFPSTYAQRVDGLLNKTSIYYQCGYSADVAGGVGNLQGGGTPFTTCDWTRSSPTDPSVGCMARMGNPSATSVAPDGDIGHDIAGHVTGRFGGVTWLAPSQYSGRQYTSGSKTFGFNQPNTAVAGSYYNWVYGTQWVQCQVLAPAGDPNSLRSEAVVCVSAFGPATVLQLLVNGVQVPYSNSDVLFTWRYINQGGRNGSLNADAIFNRHGDPHGSVCCIEFVVPAQLASPGSVPSVQALVTSGPILNCYAIASVSSGVVTFTGPNWSCAGNAGFTVQIVGNSNAALNGTFALSSWTGGNPGTITLTGTTASGTGGTVFFYQNPDLYDTGGSIANNPTGNYVNVAGPACNLAFAYLDLMTWGNVQLSQIDGASWYKAAQICAAPVTYAAANGSSQTHAQFKASFALPGNSRQPLSQVLTGLRNSGNLMVAPNSITGLIQCFVKQTLAAQQPSAVAGSNDTTARSSVTAAGSAANGYYAYLFDESNIDRDSFRVTTTRIESTPNMVSFPFQDENNGYQQDSLTEVDPIAYAYSGNQEIGVPISVLAVPNFDQGSRIANVQLAEALFGNPRNDAGGTLYFEFRTNHRVLHLASQPGAICGLKWQSLGLGVSAPQAIRILSLKPDTDGEHWQVKAMWHSDTWYTYAFGQNPTPFQQNPLLSPPQRPPYPWRPGVAVWGSSDALFPDQKGFSVDLDTSTYPAQLTIGGALAVNTQSSGKPPLVPLQASTASTGGTIKPGTYLIGFSTNGSNGPVSNFVTAVVPVGTSTNTISVAGIQWQSGAAPSILPYIGTSSMNMHACAGASYSGSSPDTNGNPTAYTFTDYTADGLGLPDINAVQYRVEEVGIVHGGNWGDVITSVDGTGKILTFAAGAWSTNQWAGSVLSLYYRPGVTTQPALNMVVTSSTATTLTMPSTGFLAGDVVVMRSKAGHITANTIGDDNLVNSYAPSGLTVNDEVGNSIYILAGTGAGQPPKTVASNTSTVYTIVGTWDVTPDATSVFIVLAPGITYDTSRVFTADGTGGTVAVMTTEAITTQEQSLLIRVGAVDSSGAYAPMLYQPAREVYIPAQATDPTPTIAVTGNVTLDPIRQNVAADATAGSFTVTLPPFTKWLTVPIAITKMDSSANVVNWATSGSDTVVGFGAAGTLTAQGQTITVTAVQP